METDRIQYLAGLLAGRMEPGLALRTGGIVRREGLWDEALHLSRHTNKQIAFRASWSLETAVGNDRNILARLIPDILAIYISTNNHSVLRSFGKLIALWLKSGPLPCPDSGPLVEKCVDLLIDPACVPAVKVWAMDILTYFTDHPIVRDNLTDILNDLLRREPPPSIRNRVRKTMLRLKKNTNLERRGGK